MRRLTRLYVTAMVLGAWAFARIPSAFPQTLIQGRNYTTAQNQAVAVDTAGHILEDGWGFDADAGAGLDAGSVCTNIIDGGMTFCDGGNFCDGGCVWSLYNDGGAWHPLSVNNSGELFIANPGAGSSGGSTGGAGGAVYILGGDGGVPGNPFTSPQLEQICCAACGTSQTAFPTPVSNRQGLIVQNQGPMAFINDTTPMNAFTPGNMALGPGTPLSSPGDSWTVNAAGATNLYCCAVGGMTDAGGTGCLEVWEIP